MTSDYFDKFYKRANNFRWNLAKIQETFEIYNVFFERLDELENSIMAAVISPQKRKLEREELVRAIGVDIFNLVMLSSGHEKFTEGFPVKGMYETLLFTTLCSFLNQSKRIAGMSLIGFIREYGPEDLRGDISCTDSNYYPRLDEAARLRKARNRKFKEKVDCYKGTQWMAMSPDTLYEWAFFYEINQNSVEVKDTFKRFGNLYKDIDQVLNDEKEDNRAERIRKAYEKFESKLSKIKYGEYLELQKVLLERVLKNEEYFGINLYRLERMMRPCILTKEVGDLLHNPKEKEIHILNRSLLLKNVEFLPLYRYFSTLSVREMAYWNDEFVKLRVFTEMSGCLILDELIENELLGNQWEELFRTMTNQMVKDVLYDPSEIDFTALEDSQDKFEKLLKMPVLEFCKIIRGEYVSIEF